jgi:hypothetical protein
MSRAKRIAFVANYAKLHACQSFNYEFYRIVAVLKREHALDWGAGGVH